jgi:hypothetical protein
MITEYTFSINTPNVDKTIKEIVSSEYIKYNLTSATYTNTPSIIYYLGLNYTNSAVLRPEENKTVLENKLSVRNSTLIILNYPHISQENEYMKIISKNCELKQIIYDHSEPLGKIYLCSK